MFGLNDNQKQINESLKPIKEQLETHSVILEEFVKFKPECSHDRRRLNDKLDLIIENQSKISVKMEKNEEYHEKNADNIQMLADFVITTKTSRKYMPTILAVIGAFVVVLVVVVVSVIYIQHTLQALT